MGGAQGRKRGLEVVEHIPDWTTGRRAGFVRNQRIVDDADRVVAFWDGSSSGTAHTIQVTRLARKPLKVYGPDGKRMINMEAPMSGD